MTDKKDTVGGTKSSKQSLFARLFKTPDEVNKKWKEKGKFVKTINNFVPIKGYQEKLQYSRKHQYVLGGALKGIWKVLKNAYFFTKDTIYILLGKKVIENTNEQKLSVRESKNVKNYAIGLSVVTSVILILSASAAIRGYQIQGTWNITPLTVAFNLAFVFYTLVTWKVFKRRSSNTQ